MTTTKAPVITVDGPSGAGKGTLAGLLTQKLGWQFLDSGALYRVVALAAKKHQITSDDIPALVRMTTALDVRFEHQAERVAIFLEGDDITDQVRLETTGNLASKIAPIQEVRTALGQRQQSFRQAPGLVADGRDMGTIVFPDAELKFYLTASAEERAKRRFLQLKEQGLNVSIARLTEEIQERDARDMERKVAPLVPASDAILLDSSVMSVEAVFEKAMSYVKARELA
jgi:cytidylate kinase